MCVHLTRVQPLHTFHNDIECKQNFFGKWFLFLFILFFTSECPHLMEQWLREKNVKVFLSPVNQNVLDNCSFNSSIKLLILNLLEQTLRQPVYWHTALVPYPRPLCLGCSWAVHTITIFLPSSQQNKGVRSSAMYQFFILLLRFSWLEFILQFLAFGDDSRVRC